VNLTQDQACSSLLRFHHKSLSSVGEDYSVIVGCVVVSADNGVVRAQPNATSKIRTTVPHGQKVTVIGTANGGAWAHILTATGLDGYIDMVQLSKP
jgi:uncharacterized protein YgiM (DUF1202 family)